MNRTELIEHLVDQHDVSGPVVRRTELPIEQLWAGHNALHLKGIGKQHGHEEPEAVGEPSCPSPQMVE